MRVKNEEISNAILKFVNKYRSLGESPDKL